MQKPWRFLVALGGVVWFGHAQAVFLDAGAYPDAAPPPQVEPMRVDVSCKLKLVAAQVNYASHQGMDKYTFEGRCTLPALTYEQLKKTANLAPNLPMPPLAVPLQVKIEAEWFEKMHRASERIVITSADWVQKFPGLGTPFSTWATCEQDPYINKNVACHDQGIGSAAHTPYVDLKDIPFGHGQTTVAAAKLLSPPVVIDPKVKVLQPVMGSHYGPGSTVLYKVSVDELPMGWQCCEAQGANQVSGLWEEQPSVVWNDLLMGHSKAYADFNHLGSKRFRARAYKTDGSQQGTWSDWVNYSVGAGNNAKIILDRRARQAAP